MFSALAKPILFLLRHPRTLTTLSWSSSISALVAAIAGVYNGLAVFDILTFGPLDKNCHGLHGAGTVNHSRC